MIGGQKESVGRANGEQMESEWRAKDGRIPS